MPIKELENGKIGALRLLTRIWVLNDEDTDPLFSGQILLPNVIIDCSVVLDFGEIADAILFHCQRNIEFNFRGHLAIIYECQLKYIIYYILHESNKLFAA